MALQVQTLKTRSLTASMFLVVMLLGLLWNHWSFFILFSVIHFGCWIEFQKLTGLIDRDYTLITLFQKYGVMLTGWCFMLLQRTMPTLLVTFPLHSLGWWLALIFIFALPMIELLLSKEVILKNIAYSATGLIYISLSWALMIQLRNYTIAVNSKPAIPDSIKILPCLLIFSIWINDTMAYIVGSIIGKTPLSKVSPKKTWEGTIGGALLSIIIMTLAGSRILGFLITDAFIISTIACITGTAGDLLESKFKRMANVKDSGRIMPGHGGFLDRFDSLLVATPFVWAYVHFFASSKV